MNIRCGSNRVATALALISAGLNHSVDFFPDAKHLSVVDSIVEDTLQDAFSVQSSILPGISRNLVISNLRCTW